MRRVGLALALLVTAAPAMADGGRLRLRQDAGPFAIAVFTAPEPLRAGPADISVLVQDRKSRAVVLDAEVEIELRPTGANEPRVFRASPGKNRLFKEARVELGTPGDWELSVRIRSRGVTESIGCRIRLDPGRPALAAIWPYLATPPLAVTLFAFGRRLRRPRRLP